MKYRFLGKTGLQVSVVGIGTYQYGGEWGRQYCQADVNAIIGRGKELGVNLIDTAECYGDHLAESLVGTAVQGERRDWIIASKFGHRFLSHQQRELRWNATEVREQLESSLRALRTDYLDIYQFHSGNDIVFQNDELWTMLQKQVQDGKVRFLGISLSKQKGIDILGQCNAASRLGASVIQINYNRLDRLPEAEIFPSCLRQELGVIARVPLASGLLSGKYRVGAQFPKDDVRSGEERGVLDARIKTVEEIRAAEVPAGVEMSQWAIAWCLQHRAVSCCIPGFKDLTQLESGAEAADLSLVAPDHPLAAKQTI